MRITKKEIGAASTAQLERLRNAVQREIEEREEKARKAGAIEEHRKRYGTVRQEYRKCGKENCRRCAEGEGHGPYFYRYYRDEPNGKLKSEYLGKTLPDEYREPEPPKSVVQPAYRPYKVKDTKP